MVSNSSCSCARVMNFFLFFRLKKSFQLLPFAWPSRVTLKLKVTLWSTWLLLSLLVCMLPRWILCCFMRFLGVRIHSNYHRVRVTITRDLETEGHVTVYVTFVFSACICPTEMIVFCFVRFLVQLIHSNYCQLRDLHAWPWKPSVTSLSTWLFDLSGC